MLRARVAAAGEVVSAGRGTHAFPRDGERLRAGRRLSKALGEQRELATLTCGVTPLRALPFPQFAKGTCLAIRPAAESDKDAIWAILEPMIRRRDTYTLPRDMSKVQALNYWFAPEKETFVWEDNGTILGTYFLRGNQQGGGARVANCGYVTATGAEGRGIARAMCLHSLQRATQRGFRAMQFNFVV